MKILCSLLMGVFALSCQAEELKIHDAERGRTIPISIGYPASGSQCKPEARCGVVFVSAGYRVPFQQYSFLTERLNALGYLTVAVDHELPSDPPLSRMGDLYTTRIENWQRGAKTLALLQQRLSEKYPGYDFDSLVLMGHSNGGDISSWLANEKPGYVSRVITLDHRRVTLPKDPDIRVLSVRATEYPTEASVLMTADEQLEYGSCVAELPDSMHMDPSDYGRPEMKRRVAEMVIQFLSGVSCDRIRQI